MYFPQNKFQIHKHIWILDTFVIIRPARARPPVLGVPLPRVQPGAALLRGGRLPGLPLHPAHPPGQPGQVRSGRDERRQRMDQRRLPRHGGVRERSLDFPPPSLFILVSSCGHVAEGDEVFLRNYFYLRRSRQVIALWELLLLFEGECFEVMTLKVKVNFFWSRSHLNSSSFLPD